jgi:hypothetical protein
MSAGILEITECDHATIVLRGIMGILEDYQ